MLPSGSTVAGMLLNYFELLYIIHTLIKVLAKPLFRAADLPAYSELNFFFHCTHTHILCMM